MGRAIGRSVFNVVGQYIRARLLIFARHDLGSLALVGISGRNDGAVKSTGNVANLIANPTMSWSALEGGYGKMLLSKFFPCQGVLIIITILANPK